MPKKAVSILVVILVILGVGTSMARESSRWRWWHNEEIIKQLNLSQDEIKQIDDAYAASRRRMIEQKSRLETERFELEEILGQPSFSEAAARAQNRKLEEVRSQLAAERFEFLLVSRKIIGHNRFQQLTDIQRQWREQRKSGR